MDAARGDGPGVSAVVPTNRPEQLDAVFAFVGRQSLPSVQLVLVQHGFETPESELKAKAADSGVTDFHAVTVDAAATLGHCMNVGVDAADGDFVAKMDDDNFYGRHYLRDLVRAFDYTSAEVVGKWAHLTHLEGSGATLLRFPQAEHRYVNTRAGRHNRRTPVDCGEAALRGPTAPGRHHVPRQGASRGRDRLLCRPVQLRLGAPVGSGPAHLEDHRGGVACRPGQTAVLR